MLSATGRDQAGPPGSLSGVYRSSVVRFLQVVTLLWFAFSAKIASHRVGGTQTNILGIYLALSSRKSLIFLLKSSFLPLSPQ